MQEREVWPGHRLLKDTEVGIISRHFRFNGKQLGLEIGCGDALESALLSGFSRKIIAADLFMKNSLTHTIGLDIASKNISLLGCKNIRIISCSNEAIAFKDNSFDFVFSSSTLEHLKDRKLALEEMRRVLKPEGQMIIILPTHMPCLYAYLHTFIYPFARLMKFFAKGPAHSPYLKKEKTGTKIPLLRKFFLNHPSFPLPEMHGAYDNIFEEFRQQLPRNWIKLMESCGLKITKSFSVCCIPWLILEPFSTKLASQVYARSKNFHIKYGHNKFIKAVSYLIGFIAVKA